MYRLILYCKKHFLMNQTRQNEAIEQDSSQPTLIYCNGNAGLYEFNYFIDDWTQLVVQEYEINIVFWSYRGYGYSTGTPSILNLCKDVEILFDYLKNEEKLGKIGVYGTSLGGLVAAHLGANRKIDFLYVDRSFACVSDIAYFTMFRIFKFIIRFLTDYDLWSPFNYLNATCYKALSYDPNDEAIGYMSSLMNGVSKSIAQNIFLGSNQNTFYSENDFSMIKNFKGFWRRTCVYNSILDKSTSLWISLPTQKKLYKTLTNILSGIKKVNQKEKQILKKEQEQNDKERNIPLQTIKKKSKVSTCQVDFDLDESYLLNNSYLIGGSDFIIEQFDANQQTFLNQSVSMIKKIELNDVRIQIEQQSPCNIETAQAQSQSNSSSVQKSQNTEVSKIKYSYNIPQNEFEFDQIKGFVKSVFTLFDQYDASGLTLLDCISSHYFPKFQTFILNLFVWGSYPPVDQTVANNPIILDHHRFAKKHSSQLFAQKENNYKAPNQVKSNNVTIDAIIVNSGIYHKNNGENDKLNFFDEKSTLQQIQSTIGNLLVVSCGHVEPYSKNEELALRNHFKNAGFI